MFLNSTSLQTSIADQRDGSHDYWFQPLSRSTGTQSGALVTPDTAMRLSTVYKVIKVISETIGVLPVHVYRDGNGEERDRINDHPLARMLSRRPNQWQTPMEFRQMVEAHRSLRGNGYAQIYWADNGKPEMVVPLHPSRVTPEVGPDGLPRYKVKTLDGSRTDTLLQGEVLHLKGLTLDGFVGLNPIEAEREALGAAMAARDYGSRFWNNDARPPFWVEVPSKFEDNTARLNFRNEWQVSYGGANRHRPAVLDRGMKIHELGLKNSDAQWLDFRKYSEVDICGLWRMPPHKVQILDRATWNNIEHQNIEFVSDCILPLAVSWEQVLWRDIVVDPAEYVTLVLEQLLRGDIKTRYEAYGSAIDKGWMLRSDARRKENLPPVVGLDRPLVAGNMAVVDEQGNAHLPSKKENDNVTITR